MPHLSDNIFVALGPLQSLCRYGTASLTKVPVLATKSGRIHFKNYNGFSSHTCFIHSYVMEITSIFQIPQAASQRPTAVAVAAAQPVQEYALPSSLQPTGHPPPLAEGADDTNQPGGIHAATLLLPRRMSTDPMEYGSPPTDTEQKYTKLYVYDRGMCGCFCPTASLLTCCARRVLRAPPIMNDKRTSTPAGTPVKAAGSLPARGEPSKPGSYGNPIKKKPIPGSPEALQEQQEREALAKQKYEVIPNNYCAGSQPLFRCYKLPSCRNLCIGLLFLQPCTNLYLYRCLLARTHVLKIPFHSCREKERNKERKKRNKGRGDKGSGPAPPPSPERKWNAKLYLTYEKHADGSITKTGYTFESWKLAKKVTFISYILVCFWPFGLERLWLRYAALQNFIFSLSKSFTFTWSTYTFNQVYCRNSSAVAVNYLCVNSQSRAILIPRIRVSNVRNVYSRRTAPPNSPKILKRAPKTVERTHKRPLAREDGHVHQIAATCGNFFVLVHAITPSCLQQLMEDIADKSTQALDKGTISVDELEVTAYDFVQNPLPENVKAAELSDGERWGHGSIYTPHLAMYDIIQEAMKAVSFKSKEGVAIKPVIVLREADVRAVFTFAMDKTAWEVTGKDGACWKLLAMKLRLPREGMEIDNDKESPTMGPNIRIIAIKCTEAWENAILARNRRIVTIYGPLRFVYKQEGTNNYNKRRAGAKEAKKPENKRHRPDDSLLQEEADVADAMADIEILS